MKHKATAKPPKPEPAPERMDIAVAGMRWVKFVALLTDGRLVQLTREARPRRGFHRTGMSVVGVACFVGFDG